MEFLVQKAVFRGQLFRLVVLALCFVSYPASGQHPYAPSTDASSIPTLRTEVKLVAVDVTVYDKNGHPVHGLKRDDFVLSEGGRDKSIRNFEENSSLTARPGGPALPAMPPGTFTNYSPVPPSG